jgi:hypothetical protein
MPYEPPRRQERQDCGCGWPIIPWCPWRTWRLGGSPTLVIALSLLCYGMDAAENLIRNGGFEQADPADATRLLAWGRIDGLGIRWLAGPTGGSGKALRFDTAVSEKDMVASWKSQGITEWDIPDASDGPVGATYGLSLYSDAVPIVTDQAYAIEVRHKGPGGGKIWVRGYAKRGDAMKRVYEAQTELGADKDWKQTVYAFHPTRHTPLVSEVKVMLYAYWPAKESWFDDVVLRTASNEELATEDARRKR